MSRNTTPALPSNPKRYLSEADAAAVCLTSRRTFQQWRWKKCGPRYIKLGSNSKGKGPVLYDYDDIVKWLESRKIRTTEAE